MAAKKATKKKATKKKATKRAATKRTRKLSDEDYVEKVLDGLKKVMLASLGVYGETLDEVHDRIDKARADMDKARKDGSTRYDKLVRRGEKVQKQAKKKISDIDLPSKDLKENLEKMREGINDLLDTIFERE